MDAAGLSGGLFDLLVDLEGVVLELRDVGVGVERVHAARRVPGRAGSELGAFEQGHVFPAVLGEVVKDAATDHASADDGHPDMRFHGLALRLQARAEKGRSEPAASILHRRRDVQPRRTLTHPWRTSQGPVSSPPLNGERLRRKRAALHGRSIEMHEPDTTMSTPISISISISISMSISMSMPDGDNVRPSRRARHRGPVGW